MDCQDDIQREESKNKFQQVKTYKEFLALWSKFYSNKVCIPTYFSVFVGAEDNPQATTAMGKKFQQIVKNGLIPFDFQVNDQGSQKAYILALVPVELANAIAVYVNRYSGFVSFYQDIPLEPDTDILGEPKSLFITYDATDEVMEFSRKKGVFLGDPYTHLGSPDGDTFEMIKEWLSEDVRNILNQNNFVQLTVIDTIPSAEPDRILGLVINALDDNKSLVKQVLKKL